MPPKPLDPEIRFWRYVDLLAMRDHPTRCAEWQGVRNSMSYGRFGVNNKHHWKTGKSRMVLAHRWAYEHFVSPIPDGMCVLHRCDNPSCVRPSHLFLGSRSDNMRDAKAKGRARNQTGVLI